MLISNQPQFDTFFGGLQGAINEGAPLCFDTEFLSEKRYFARLCLVQVRAGDHEAALDPFKLDLSRFLQLVEDPAIPKIVHAGSVDLQILFQTYEARAQNVFDTQIAAAFLGYGHQIGYADLVKKTVGAPISKVMQYTDWAARPLSGEQIEYALSDVAYLTPIYEELRARLESRGRLGWAQTEFARAQERATRVETDENAYKRLSLNGLSRKSLAVLRETAKVREAIARGNDRPPSFIVPDLALVQLARQQPKTIPDLRAIRGMPGIPDRDARQILAAIETALRSDPKSWPEQFSHERPDPRLDPIVSLLGVVIGARATAQEVSRNYLGRRDELFALAQWWLDGMPEAQKPTVELLEDWRFELVGRDLLQLLRGESVIALDAQSGLPQLKNPAI